MDRTYNTPNQTVPAFDENGFLIDPSVWNDDIASLIARREGLEPLSAEQWQVIHALRDHYQKMGSLPAFRLICHREHLGDHCMSTLFHQDIKEAWRIAGLPDPGEEAKAYM